MLKFRLVTNDIDQQIINFTNFYDYVTTDQRLEIYTLKYVSHYTEINNIKKEKIYVTYVPICCKVSYLQKIINIVMF